MVQIKKKKKKSELLSFTDIAKKDDVQDATHIRGVYFTLNHGLK